MPSLLLLLILFALWTAQLTAECLQRCLDLRLFVKAHCNHTNTHHCVSQGYDGKSIKVLVFLGIHHVKQRLVEKGQNKVLSVVKKHSVN